MFHSFRHSLRILRDNKSRIVPATHCNTKNVSEEYDCLVFGDVMIDISPIKDADGTLEIQQNGKVITVNDIKRNELVQ